MRITKSIAEQTAKSLIEAKRKELESKKQDVKNFLTPIVKAKIPKEILSSYSNFPDYFSTYNYVRLVGNGFNYRNFNINEKLPLTKSEFNPDEKQAKKLSELVNKYDDFRDKLNKLETELINAIFNLKTYKSVEENFPEAFLLLPKIENNKVMINLSDIRNKLK